MRIPDTYPANINGMLLCKLEEAKVTMADELIDTKMMCWSDDKLEENFIETDRRLIHQIPLGRFAEDEWALSRENMGSFW
jgi:hypothetical protein